MAKRAASISGDEAIVFLDRVQDAVNTHDIPRLMDFYHEDAVVVSPAFKTISGRAAILASWEVMFSTFPDWKTSTSDVLVDGDRIAAFGTCTATDLNGWFGLAPTGKPISYRGILLLTVIDGKIARDERLYDLSAVLEGLEKARLDQELRTAAEVQAALLPRGARIGHYYEAIGDATACRTIGGDFFEFVELEPGDFGVALGDVAGKGPAAALLAAMLQGMFSVEARAGNGPSVTMSRINRALVDRGLGSQFATLVYGVLSSDGRFIYSNAGHNPPIVVSKGAIRRLITGGTILGAFKDATFEEETLRLKEGDVVIMFSDGVTEARNKHEEEFGEHRLISCVTAGDAPPTTKLGNTILDAVHGFCEEAPQADDITVAVTRFRPQTR